MFKELGGLASLMKQAQEITGRVQGLNEQKRQLRATGSAGGGMVEIEVNGLNEVLGCRIDEGLVAQGDRELLEDLVVTAVNQAVAKVAESHAEAMKEITGSLNVPGLDNALGKIMGNVSDDSPPAEPSG